jgi:hypothetical protein
MLLQQQPEPSPWLLLRLLLHLLQRLLWLLLLLVQLSPV